MGSKDRGHNTLGSVSTNVKLWPMACEGSYSARERNMKTWQRGEQRIDKLVSCFASAASIHEYSMPPYVSDIA